jgi:hypothetical protein
MADDAHATVPEGVNESLRDETAHALRLRLAEAIPRHLTENGSRLSLHHRLGGTTAGVGFATATEMTGELGEGAACLFNAGLWYPGAAVVRQLIECGYLLSLMDDRPEEAEAWMRSTRQQIVSTFQPRHMRERSSREFRSSEYQSHCDWGGHPNPAGSGLLRRHEEWRPLDVRWLWLDLVQHLAEIWETFCSALRHYDPRMDPDDLLWSPHRSPGGGTEIAALVSDWRERDSLARRQSIPRDFVPGPASGS